MGQTASVNGGSVRCIVLFASSKEPSDETVGRPSCWRARGEEAVEARRRCAVKSADRTSLAELELLKLQGSRKSRKKEAGSRHRVGRRSSGLEVQGVVVY